MKCMPDDVPSTSPSIPPHIRSIGVKLNIFIALANTSLVMTYKNSLAFCSSGSAPLILTVSHADPTR